MFSQKKKGISLASVEEDLASTTERTRRKALAALLDSINDRDFGFDFAKSALPQLLVRKVLATVTSFSSSANAAASTGGSASGGIGAEAKLTTEVLFNLCFNRAMLHEASSGEYLVGLMEIASNATGNHDLEYVFRMSVISLAESAGNREKILPGLLKTESRGKRYADHLMGLLSSTEISQTLRSEMLSMLWNMTAINDCRPIFATGPNIAIMLKTLTTYPDNKTKHAISAFFHNTSQHSDDLCDLLRSQGVVQALSPIVTQKVDGRLSAMMAIVNLIGSKETKDTEIMVADNGMIERIVGELKGVLFGYQYFHKEESGESKSTFDLSELLLAMSRLSVNDKNKRKFFDAGVVDLIAVVLEKEVPSEKSKAGTPSGAWEDRLHEMEDSLTYALKTLINLCFVEELCAELLKNVALLKLIVALQDNEELSKRVKDSAARFLWATKNGGDSSDPSLVAAQKLNDSVAQDQQQAAGKHVMLSYSWSDQAAVLKIKNCLKAAGYQVWIDVESLSGSTVDSMSHAVEGSVVVLICYSERYKQSQNCRMEANYALQRGVDIVPLMMQRNYNPDGWLGLMLASRLYVDFSSPETFDSKFKALISELGNRGKIGAGEAAEGNRTVIAPATVAKAAGIEAEKIENWLKEQGFGAHIEAFRGHDMLEGSALVDFLEISLQNVSFAHEQLQSQLGVKSLGLRLKFFRELRTFLQQ